MTKEELREKLFERHFECKDGILITELMNTIKPITEAYYELKNLLMNQEIIEDYSSVNRVNLIKHNDKEYLILNLSSALEYLVINIENKKVLNEDEVLNIFDKKVFLNDLKQINKQLGEEWLEYIRFIEYEGDVKTIIDYYNQNKYYFNINPDISYELSVEQAWTSLDISLNHGTAQLSFLSLDQFIYEHLFLDADLNPCAMQDATEKIGYEKMLDMFKKVKEIIISKEIIPVDLLAMYYSRDKKKTKTLIRN